MPAPAVGRGQRKHSVLRNGTLSVCVRSVGPRLPAKAGYTAPTPILVFP